MSEKPLSAGDAALADALGAVIAQLRDERRREMLAVAAEARAAVLEVKLAAIEAALDQHTPEAVAKLRSIAGGRGQ